MACHPNWLCRSTSENALSSLPPGYDGGLVERFNRTIKAAINVAPTQNDEWLATLTYANNTATHGTHGFAPTMQTNSSIGFADPRGFDNWSVSGT
ncbi:hypothetical protein DYB37_011834 [Aphanomyces astaci]|uniref:Uncharacterized protein n=1 Tax=Aphanomyces astaci TaxID=112090 RepID=A0A418FJ58_APHAT|nr:hypothetical protein DYB35_009682 [Aphanomyces astaci]RHZ30490.1 hypothetical protein DYB37_011834 [Aphanomyces astaci]